MKSAEEVFDLLGRVSAKLHVYKGRVGGTLHASHPTWARVALRGSKGETIQETLARGLAELHRRMVEGMPRTTHVATCGACGTTDSLRYVVSAKQWLCAECRRGLREMATERRRARKRKLG